MRSRPTLVVLALVALMALMTVLGPTAAVATPMPVGADVDYQLGGAVAPAPGVGIVVRDRTAAPVPGLWNVCYVNAFQTQPGRQGRREWARHPGLVLRDDAGRPVRDEAWGELLLDLRTPASRRGAARVVGRWIAGCAADGFDAVELDNLDSWTRSHGLLHRRHATAYARLLVDAAHDHGLEVAQKNAAGLDGRRLGFDLAVAEECGRYDECGRYTASYGDRVLVVEYRARDFEKTCAAWGDRLAVVLRDRDLSPGGVRRWC